MLKIRIIKCKSIDCNKRSPSFIDKAIFAPDLKSRVSRYATFDNSWLKPVYKTTLDSFPEAMLAAVCFGSLNENTSDILIQAEGPSIRRLE